MHLEIIVSNVLLSWPFESCQKEQYFANIVIPYTVESNYDTSPHYPTSKIGDGTQRYTQHHALVYVESSTTVSPHLLGIICAYEDSSCRRKVSVIYNISGTVKVPIVQLFYTRYVNIPAKHTGSTKSYTVQIQSISN